LVNKETICELLTKPTLFQEVVTVAVNSELSAARESSSSRLKKLFSEKVVQEPTAGQTISVLLKQYVVPPTEARDRILGYPWLSF